MKKIIAANLIGLAAIAATPAMASVSNTGSTQIGGTLAQSCSLTPPADKTDLNVTSTSEQTIGNATYSCNFSGTGAGISISTGNGGQLKSGTNTVAYQLKLGGGSYFAPTIAPQSAESPSITAANSAQTSSLKITLGAAATIAGTYTDTVNLTIAP
jgi:hypothetical protein